MPAHPTGRRQRPGHTNRVRVARPGTCGKPACDRDRRHERLTATTASAVAPISGARDTQSVLSLALGAAGDPVV